MSTLGLRAPTYPAQVEYRLTAFGRELEPVLKAMLKVAERVRAAAEGTH